MKKRWKPSGAMAIGIAMLMLGSPPKSVAQSRVPSLRFQRVQFSGSDPDPEDKLPRKSVTMCLEVSSIKQCYTPPKHDPVFGLSPKTELVLLSQNVEALQYTVEASGGGSGSLTLVALLQNGPAGSKVLKNLLPDIFLTEQSEHQYWYEPTVSSRKLFVTADYVWGKGETHFSKHRFKISCYQYDESLDFYQLQDQYMTSRKYESFDEVNTLKVLAFERPEILSRLRRQQATSR